MQQVGPLDILPLFSLVRYESWSCACVCLWFVFLLVGSIEPAQAVRGERPNIVFVLADDVGWADVSWNNKEMR